MLALEVVAILGGGAVLGFVPEKKIEAPKPAKVEAAPPPRVSIKSTPVEIPSEEERARLAEMMRININTASEMELQDLPGVGPSTAKAIVAYRDENGPFKSVDDLDNISGFGPSTVEKIRPKARVE